MNTKKLFLFGLYLICLSISSSIHAMQQYLPDVEITHQAAQRTTAYQEILRILEINYEFEHRLLIRLQQSFAAEKNTHALSDIHQVATIRYNVCTQQVINMQTQKAQFIPQPIESWQQIETMMQNFTHLSQAYSDIAQQTRAHHDTGAAPA